MEITTWSAAALERIDDARELEIAVERADGTLRPYLPIWVVRAGPEVYVRTWYRRETGWFGRVLRSHRARVRVPGVESDVVVEDVGTENREAVDAAYRAKYGSAESMVNESASASTLRLVPRPAAGS